MNGNPYYTAYEQARAELEEITLRFDNLRHRKDQLTKLRDMLGTLISPASGSVSSESFGHQTPN